MMRERKRAESRTRKSEVVKSNLQAEVDREDTGASCRLDRYIIGQAKQMSISARDRVEA